MTNAAVPFAGHRAPRTAAERGHVAAMPLADSDERTRDRVLGAVLEHGPISAAELGDMLGFTPAAVRRHLDHLARSGDIEVKRVAKAGAGAGRPARRYVLSSQGQSTLGNDYLDIATLALKQLQAVAGDDAVRAFAVERFADMERRYALEVEQAGPDITARAQALSTALSRDGFVASAASIEAKARCRQHCPASSCARGTAPSSSSPPSSLSSAMWRPKCSPGW
ncbi:transcriptional regulator protein [Arthrobacter sp. Hiyo4]|nr:transcriptional regulator protein [Arthrobacter sp. Hiyo4]